MGLIGNGTYINRIPARSFGGGVAADITMWDRSDSHNVYGGGIDQKSSVPVGYRPSYCWTMAIKNGGVGSTMRIFGSGNIGDGNLAGGLNGASSISGVGGIYNSDMSLVMFAQAALSGSSTMSAPATASLNMAINMLGTCSMSADIEYGESKNIYANLQGMSVMSAPLGALAGMVGNMSGTGGICCSTISAKAHMSSDIAPATQVTSTAIAQAVWAAIAADNAATGSMGEAVQAASGGLVPPSVEEIAAKVLEVLYANKIPVNTMQIKGQNIVGAGTAGNPWGPE